MEEHVTPTPRSGVHGAEYEYGTVGVQTSLRPNTHELGCSNLSFGHYTPPAQAYAAGIVAALQIFEMPGPEAPADGAPSVKREHMASPAFDEIGVMVAPALPTDCGTSPPLSHGRTQRGEAPCLSVSELPLTHPHTQPQVRVRSSTAVVETWARSAAVRTTRYAPAVLATPSAYLSPSGTRAPAGERRAATLS